jgi:acetoin utilization deacetylase AcuC-like enzyme
MKHIPVYYTPLQVAPAEGYSPSAQKPAQVVADWVAAGLPVDIRVPAPVTVADLCRAHDRAYVEGVLSCTLPNGFGRRSRAVADSLPYTSGAMLDAAHEALRNGRVAVAPVSGFHHAHHARGGGFCTFNGLVVAAAALLADGRARRVGILDCDEHEGDGTAEILERLRMDAVQHVTVGRDWGAPSQAEAFLAALPDMVASFAGCDVLLYQAGADPHIDDPLGGWLTTAQLAERDARVFAACRALGLPVAWNLAGGYQRAPDGSIPAVLEIHRNTLHACVEAFVERVPAAASVPGGVAGGGKPPAP